MTENAKKMLEEIQYPDLKGTKDEVELAEKMREAFTDYYMKKIDSHKAENHVDDPKTYASRCKKEERDIAEMKATIENLVDAVLWLRYIGKWRFVDHYSWDTVARDEINWNFGQLGDKIAYCVMEEGLSKEGIAKEIRATTRGYDCRAKDEFAIEHWNGKLQVFTPYEADFVRAIKRIAGSKWNSDEKCWEVPESSIERVRQIMKDVYGHDDTEADE